jgi:hypothetical protein
MKKDEPTMIKTTLGTLLEANTPVAPGVPSPLGQLMMIPLPVSKAWKRLALFEDIEAEIMRHNKLKAEIITRHGDKDDQGHVAEIEPSHPNFNQAVKEIAELSLIEVEFDFDAIKGSDLGNGFLSPYDLRVLKTFLIVQ